MAVTITRTDWIDDDGSGTTGTVLNNAVKTDLYNQIDAALAKVAQLTGGNAFTGNQSIAGTVAVTGFGFHSFVGSGAGIQTFTVQNTLAGTGNGCILNLGNDVAPNTGMLQVFASNYTTNAGNIAGGVGLVGQGAGGLSLTAYHATGGVMRFFAGGFTERMRILPTGPVLINSLNTYGQLVVAAVGPGTAGVSIQNTDPGNNFYFATFVNSVGGFAGVINQIAAASVAYTTSSDMRLKDDDGRATDLSALRAVVVHDFRWKSDSIRDRGVFAQEAISLFPHAVVEGTDERTEDGTLKHPWMTDYSKFVADLIVGWQQHDAELTHLRAALATLKGSH